MPSKPKTEIYIPTRGRIGFNRQVTLREFLDFSDCRPYLVCPPDEVEIHREYYGKVLPCSRKGIGPTRQWILEQTHADLLIMADDDMRFSYRPDPAVAKLERLEDLNRMIRCIEKWVWVNGFAHGGLGARQGNNRKDMATKRKGQLRGKDLVQPCDRVNNFHFCRPQKVMDFARFDALPVMEDFHYTLSLLTAGIPNVVIHNYVWNQEGSGKDGGCSLYRTPEVQAQGADGLHEAFPDFVKVVEKTSKDTSTAWKDFKTRKDVIIQWAKAANYGGIIL